ncbi:hypothetical protein [Methylogaea oryzae]|uniref:hypothetical protein n=1 Tax=Methylogaea oryzae TaxID=1295382 RepID=UPI0006D027C4|nr:hypothetical protein [Methylogaea oryzae]
MPFTGPTRWVAMRRKASVSPGLTNTISGEKVVTWAWMATVSAATAAEASAPSIATTDRVSLLMAVYSCDEVQGQV